jgi:hypothetical protein
MGVFPTPSVPLVFLAALCLLVLVLGRVAGAAPSVWFPARSWRRMWMKRVVIAFYAVVMGVVGGWSSASARAEALRSPFPVAPTAAVFASPSGCVTVIVRPGDTLSLIGQRLGVPWLVIYAQNRATIGPDPNRIVPGEVLHECPQPSPAPSPGTGASGREPCRSPDYWLPVITQWAVPPGCYGYVYQPDPADYPYRPGWGWCNWWPEEMHPTLSGDEALHLPFHRTPRVGATVWFAPHEQGASADGHWAELVAINPDGYWLLISEMNDDWRGAGWDKVNYRYIHWSAGVWFLY